MVEEIVSPYNKPKSKTARPRPVYLWNVLDVQKWLRRHCSDYYQLYHEKFLYIFPVGTVEEMLPTNGGLSSLLYRLGSRELSKQLLQFSKSINLWHDITGRALLRVNENILLRLGIEKEEHRMDIWREIMKLHLKTDILEIRDIERRNNMNYD